jgi:hypothetical protein
MGLKYSFLFTVLLSALISVGSISQAGEKLSDQMIEAKTKSQVSLLNEALNTLVKENLISGNNLKVVILARPMSPGIRGNTIVKKRDEYGNPIPLDTLMNEARRLAQSHKKSLKDTVMEQDADLTAVTDYYHAGVAFRNTNGSWEVIEAGTSADQPNQTANRDELEDFVKSRNPDDFKTLIIVPSFSLQNALYKLYLSSNDAPGGIGIFAKPLSKTYNLLASINNPEEDNSNIFVLRTVALSLSDNPGKCDISCMISILKDYHYSQTQIMAQGMMGRFLLSSMGRRATGGKMNAHISENPYAEELKIVAASTVDSILDFLKQNKFILKQVEVKAAN